MEMHSLADLSDRTGISHRKLRYCVDHELVPAATWKMVDDAVGRPRAFDETTAVLFVCAALLMESGVKRDAVRRLMGLATRHAKPGRHRISRSAIHDSVENRKEATLKIGDATHMRWIVGEYDSGWLEVERFQIDSAFEPQVVITLEISRIRRSVLGE